MPLAISASVYEQVPASPGVAAHVAAAVRAYLDTVPHAEAAKQEYEQFIARGELNMQEHAPEFLRWVMIERQAHIVAKRAAAEMGSAYDTVVALDIG